MPQENQGISKFFIAGINYKKTDASVRGQFAINNDQYENILALAPSFGLKDFFILSTCNRTEIYGFAESSTELIDLLCTQTVGTKETFTELSYIKNGKQAVQHLFEVGAGLESQILGDYEIIGQIKLAVRFAKERGFVSAILDRMINCVLASTKVIKNNTALSGGTVSVSFAAVQYIKKHVQNICDKKILLLGVGKIGRNTCKNVVDYLETKNITLINRTEEKAAELAQEIGLQYAPLADLNKHIEASDIILVSTNAVEPTILKSQLENKGNKIIIDLSIPYNVEKAAEQLPNVQLVNVDELSKLKDETLQKREAEIPKAKEIIADYLQEFLEWTNMRKHAPILHALKQKLHDMHHCEMFLSAHPTYTSVATDPRCKYAIQKVLNTTAVKMRNANQPGCNYIHAINEFITNVN
ncbi:MAG: glutamyl-tRNA reductase [Segetibacter sp.]|nr:glutamyl-tRNA reductase [Segetibacter sp.]